MLLFTDVSFLAHIYGPFIYLPRITWTFGMAGAGVDWKDRYVAIS